MRFRYLGLMLVYGLLFLAFFYLASFFGLRPGGSMWYPAAGLRLALLLIYGWRLTPGLVVVEILAVALYGVLRPSSRYNELIEVFQVASSPLCYGAGVWVLTRYVAFDIRLRRQRDVAWLSAVAVIYPIIFSVWGRGVLVLSGTMEARDFVSSAVRMFIGDTIGILMLTPLLLVAHTHWMGRANPIATSSEISLEDEMRTPLRASLLLDFVAIWISLFVLHSLPAWFDGLDSHVHWYLAFLPFIWISFRNGLVGSIAAVLALTSGAAWLTYLPVASIRFHELQILVMFISLVSLLMGSAISTQRQVRYELRRAQLNLEDLVEQRTAQVEVLSGLLPICTMCKKVRDDRGYWDQIETYLGKHTAAQFSHGLCPECLKQYCTSHGIALELES